MENEVYEKDYGEEFRERSDKAKGQATIDLYQSHFEFCDREALTLLREIAERAENVTFSIKGGLLRMTIFIGYFDEVY